ncbi:MAG TPA: cyanophycin synthetase, partial [Tissierellales bacterium]|nr:cyanophycin synthetase [Tissierellales bacterium]
ASIIAAHTYGVSMGDITEYIFLYQGVHRRLELKGNLNGVKIMDDYAHHPTEIKATLKSLRNISKGDIYCIFQPHTFTRTKALLNSFADSFQNANKTIITDIYAAREIDNGEIHSKDLSKAINNMGHNSIYIPTFKEIEEYLLLNAKRDDIIITMGAGNIYLVGESLLKQLENQNEKAAV